MRPSAASETAAAAAKEFAADVEYYLQQEPRQLPSRYLYDALGSALFDAICELPWYRITRAELGLLDAHGRAVFSLASPLSRIVELGPGNGSKLMTLVHAGRAAGSSGLTRALSLDLIDVSGAALDEASDTLAGLPDVEIARHQATYETGMMEVAAQPRPPGRTLMLFLGSNIGNFDPPGADAFLRAMRAALAQGDALLVGADLVKPARELRLAYDDPLGVTAAFNRNLLLRINRELGGDFDVNAFAHRAWWNSAESRVEMHLVSRRRQRVRVPAARIDFTMDEGETIWTESSYKYEPQAISTMLEAAGFQPTEQWLAPADRFALTMVRAV
jgi:L-histidine Nalpha-methyltransferase